MSDFMQAIQRIVGRKRPFLMAGQRWDLDVTESLSFGPDWEEALRRRVTEAGRLAASFAIDYFVFLKGLFGDVPPFAIGRMSWDNWLLYRARKHRAALIDASPLVMAVHQNHDYSHHPDGERGVMRGPESGRNAALSGGCGLSLRDATHLLTDHGPVLAINLMLSRLEVLPVLYPVLERPIRMLVSTLAVSRPMRQRLGLVIPRRIRGHE
jgi:hypothetical protein